MSPSVLAQAKGYGVEVRAVSPELQEARPGGIVSISLRVTNRTDGEEEFLESLRLPPNWRSLIPELGFVLPASGATTRIVAFQVPVGAAAGRYEISYSVRSQRDYAIHDEDTVEVNVLAVAKLALILESKPQWVIAGDEYQAKVRIINQGNAALEIQLAVESEKTYPASIAPTELTLPAGNSEVATVTVKTDAKESKPRFHAVQVQARAVNLDNGETVASLAIAVDIIPRVTKAVDLTHRVPATLTLRLNGEGSDAAGQVELRGRGYLDEEGTKSVEFLLRHPDCQAEGAYGLLEEYWLNYSRADLDVRVGDQAYGLSPLTEYFRYGRGLEVTSRSHQGRTEWLAYLLQGRWGSSLREIGAYASILSTQRTTFKINLLSRETDSLAAQPGTRDKLWSFETHMRPSNWADLRLEYARSDSDRDGGARDDASRIEWQGRGRRSSYYSFTKTHAGPDYRGYYNDSDYTTGSFIFPLGDRLRGHISLRRWEQNLDMREDRGSAPRESAQQVGLSYSLASKWQLSLDAERFRRRDALLPADFDYEERPLILAIDRSSDKYSLRFDVHSGKQQDFVTGQSRHVRHYNLLALYRPSPKQIFSLYGGVGDRDTLDGSYLLSNRDNVGLTVSLRPRENLRLDLAYLKYGFRSDRAEDRKELLARYILPDGRSWSLRVRNTSHEVSRSGTVYLLEYSIPLGIPVGRKRSIGVISGRVYDAQHPEKAGIPDVILTANGAIAVTDKRGRFIFPALAPGGYALRVDLGSIGLNRVPESKEQLLVNVKGGEVSSLDIAITDAARVAGTIMVYPRNGNGNGRANVNGNGNGSIVHDGKGSFVVGDPGGANGNGSGNRYRNGNGTASTADNGRESFVVGDPQGANANGNANRNTNGHGPTNEVLAEPWGLRNVLVEISNGEEVIRTLTDYKGDFLFEGMHPGHWRLKVYDHNLPDYHYFEATETDLVLKPGASEHVLFRVFPRLRRIRIVDEGTVKQ